MWSSGWRERLWDDLARGDREWDVIIAGGGIAGAGVLREAVRAGLRALLLEGRDFTWGTSSRSSKLVHGGIRYLQHGHWRLTRESLRERDRLLREAPGLVEPMYFLRPVYAGESRWLYRGAFLAYGILAGRRQHAFHDAAEVLRRAPPLRGDGLGGAYGYLEAGVDDARLVLRLLREAVRGGGQALSHARVEGLAMERGVVAGVGVRDTVSGRTAALRARAVVNATGAAADVLRAGVSAPPVVRPLRGSHLVFSAARVPLVQALSMRHPGDGRHVFVAPWEGAVMIGTTDCDHAEPAGDEPRVSSGEAAYLMQAMDAYFPSLDLAPADVLATWAGVRPVIGHAGTDPSSESREGLLVDERGLISVTGGKLTTVRPTALAALDRVLARCGRGRPAGGALLDPLPEAPAPAGVPAPLWRRLGGFYGVEAADVVAAAREGELQVIPGTRTCWAQVRHAARAEGVVHLDDLLLRRVRIGLVLPEGGRAAFPAVRAICAAELGWDAARWDGEEQRYLDLLRASYGCAHLHPAVTLGGGRATQVNGSG